MQSFAQKLPEMKLETLWLWAVKVGDPGVSALADALPKTQIFEVGLGGNACSNVSMSGAPVRHIGPHIWLNLCMCVDKPPSTQRCSAA